MRKRWSFAKSLYKTSIRILNKTKKSSKDLRVNVIENYAQRYAETSCCFRTDFKESAQHSFKSLRATDLS